MIESLVQKFQQIDSLLAVSNKICIAAHENPDPDAVSSVLILHNVLKGMNKQSIPYLPDSPSKSISYLPGFSDIKNNIEGLNPDLIICLDYGDFKRLRIPESISCKVVTIDHHVKSDQRGDVIIIESQFSSTTEIIYHWLEYKQILINNEIATCLLTGIISDSGGFRHSSTSWQTLDIVSNLLAKGVSLNNIADQVLTSGKSLKVSKAWGKVLSRTKLDSTTKLAYSWLNFEEFKNLEVSFVDFKGIANIISSGSPNSIGLFMLEYEKGKVRGSLRSEPKGEKDVIGIAKALGGGGHPYAAGFQQEADLDEVLKKVLLLV